MENFILDFMNKFGYLGIFLLIALENIFPPIPSEIILTFGGFMTTYSDLNVFGVIVVSTIGSVAGTLVLYYFGKLMNTERLERFFESRWGKILRVKRTDVERAEKWFLKRGNKTVFFCRFIPIVRSLISIPAGSAGMKFAPFITLTICGSCIWNTALILLGRLAGNAWEQIAVYFNSYSLIALGAFVIAFIVFLVIFIKKRFF